MNNVTVCYSPEHVESFNGPPILFDNVVTCEMYCEPGSCKVSPIKIYSFKKLTLRMHRQQLEMWLDFILAHPTIEELVIWFRYHETLSLSFRHLEKVRHKLNKIRKSTKLISFRINETVQAIKKIVNFLKTQQWFTTFSIVFDRFSLSRCITKMEDFVKQFPQMKNYILKKHLLSNNPFVDLKKCE